ncbi:MAG: nucleotide exchange factor GrpE [Xanthomonadales bacterium]|nr:nucleotide exchange factor GrpE [Xanthomonadales bacterium]
MENTNPAPASGEQGRADDSVAGGDETLGKLINEYEAKLGEMREILLRERAELDNQRKRLQRDLEQARKFANERLLGDLLPVLDNLERGLAADKGEGGGLRAGVELTLRELQRVAAGHGLVAVDAVGAPFDPERHQAMTMVQTAAQPPDTVVAVLQKGYVLNDRLLRPALVSVAQAEGA